MNEFKVLMIQCISCLRLWIFTPVLPSQLYYQCHVTIVHQTTKESMMPLNQKASSCSNGRMPIKQGVFLKPLGQCLEWSAIFEASPWHGMVWDVVKFRLWGGSTYLVALFSWLKCEVNRKSPQIPDTKGWTETKARGFVGYGFPEICDCIPTWT